MKRRNRMDVWVDGACQPNPGEMAIGVWSPDLKFKLSEKCGPGTNNMAEYLALVQAINKLNRRRYSAMLFVEDAPHPRLRDRS